MLCNPVSKVANIVWINFISSISISDVVFVVHALCWICWQCALTTSFLDEALSTLTLKLQVDLEVSTQNVLSWLDSLGAWPEFGVVQPHAASVLLVPDGRGILHCPFALDTAATSKGVLLGMGWKGCSSLGPC